MFKLEYYSQSSARLQLCNNLFLKEIFPIMSLPDENIVASILFLFFLFNEMLFRELLWNPFVLFSFFKVKHI